LTWTDLSNVLCGGGGHFHPADRLGFGRFLHLLQCFFVGVFLFHAQNYSRKVGKIRYFIPAGSTSSFRLSPFSPVKKNFGNWEGAGPYSATFCRQTTEEKL